MFETWYFCVKCPFKWLFYQVFLSLYMFFVANYEVYIFMWLVKLLNDMNHYYWRISQLEAKLSLFKAIWVLIKELQRSESGRLVLIDLLNQIQKFWLVRMDHFNNSSLIQDGLCTRSHHTPRGWIQHSLQYTPTKKITFRKVLTWCFSSRTNMCHNEKGKRKIKVHKIIPDVALFVRQSDKHTSAY